MSPISLAPTHQGGSKKIQRRDSILSQVLRQSANLNKKTFYTVPVYWNGIQIGALEADNSYLDDFDPIRTYATI